MRTPGWFKSFNLVSALLLPLSIVYWLASKAVFISRLFCRKTSKTPVICVGGLLEGGVGKTPIVREIAAHLNAPVVMRGFGGHNVRAGAPVRKTDLARDVGDEAKMLADAGLTVYVGSRRENMDVINYGPERPAAIVMDDGFQNPSIRKDVSVLAFDAGVESNYLILPAGAMRETLRHGIKRCDAVLLNGHEPRVMKMAKRLRKPVFFIRKEMNAANLFGKFIAFAGIGYPDKFFESLRRIPTVRLVGRVPFPDHHLYGKDDIIRLFRMARQYEAGLICTEKDWVKLPLNIRKKIKYAPLKTVLPPNFYVWLDKKLAEKTEIKNDKDKD